MPNRNSPSPQPPLRTVVYIDGFNFYYCEVRGTPYKWLDPFALFSRVLDQRNTLVKIRYFTARVQPTPYDPDANVRQDAYLRALRPIARWSKSTSATSCAIASGLRTPTRRRHGWKYGRTRRRVRT